MYSANKKTIWPTMITPFTEDNKLDFNALEQMIEWYIDNHVDGLFAVCQSSEMTYLSLEERFNLASFVVKATKNRLRVVASGHISDDFNDQVKEINKMAETGAEAIILINSRIANQNESEDDFKRNLDKLLKEIPEDIDLGFYECPHPYHRLFSPETLRYVAKMERFKFLKDTCCNLDIIKARLDAIKGTSLKLFNANSNTYYESLLLGVDGFCGTMGNFHPKLYAWLSKNYSTNPYKAKEIGDFLGMASTFGSVCYPVNAKYLMSLEGIDINLFSRRRDFKELGYGQKMMTEQFLNYSKKLYESIKL